MAHISTPPKPQGLYLSIGVLLMPTLSQAASEAMDTHLTTTPWGLGVLALMALMLLLYWNRTLKKRMILLTTKNIAITQAMKESTLKATYAMEQSAAVLNTVPSPVFYKDRHGTYLGCNQAFATMILGIAPDDIIGKSLTDMPDKIPPELAKKYHAKDQELIDSPGTQFYEARVRCADGETREFFFSKATMVTPKGEVAGIAGVMLDITQRKKAEQDLKESRERFRCLQEASFGGVIIHERGRIIDCNKTLADITGYSQEELVGMDGQTLISPEYQLQAKSNILAGQEKPFDAMGIRKDGTPFPIEVKGRILSLHGRMVRMAEIRDITERKKSEEEREALIATLDRANKKLSELSTIDALTGLYSKGHIIPLLDHEFKKSKRTHRPATLILADIDGFTHINQIYGHPFGDRVLQRISRLLLACVREVDLVGRFGGDEFLILLPDTDLGASEKVTGRIHSSLRELSWRTPDFSATLSMGVAEYDPDRNNDPLKEADRRLSKTRKKESHPFRRE
ncbi:sensor domain-containing diguanylate cyclase [Desulfoluna sp.]|uniref:sensor domain-containing diguanylate cyclase n=1 Tax=Desulfoluna sp. TaxID=2045199 RepID=UPI002609D71C|nr:sensor domain-containing diguanylate cyclase [Desulfoluna sp.]